MSIGFIGLGVMGQPMALNLASHLAAAGEMLIVWNQTAEKCAPLRAAGAEVAARAEEVFEKSSIVFLMMVDDAATDAVLGRGTPGFAQNVSGRVVVNMGTSSTGYSAALAAEIAEAGGRYVEAPVSGSRKPAEEGTLVAMVAGEADAVAKVRPLLSSMSAKVVECGAVPSALAMKLSVNLYLIATVTALAESFHLATHLGVDLAQFTEVLNAGPMGSAISKGKLQKLLDEDFTVQAAIADVLKNSGLVFDAARSAGVASPLLDASHSLYQETAALGLSDQDMAAVVKAIAARTARQSSSPLED
ncbi:NAD(P)-dependent oxidoreductase [Methyloligella sp. 2.7D]|uniref:NAD(P)-dependent oxidoreductase n=1 Tax=unclassified Methyloligella TaxID=2625955 RepID=UPI00157DE8DA|nr:NAD(P)-dependent oxidoreductase [Methyloligella sp. GL2]QKP77225.1 NAD(P)-dependent oxidoreductase [Methyloligella sp. GL2]